MNEAQVRIFVSSPADVEHERAIVKEIIGRLAQEFLPYFEIVPILWEEEALTADRTFQAGMVQPSDCEIVLVVLWTRLGSPLPQEPYQGMTGTEWEFFNAVGVSSDGQGPEVLVYKKTNPKLVDITNPQATQAAIEDRQRLEEFFRRNFFNQDQTFRRAFRTFDSDAAFRNMVEAQLRKLLNRRIFVERRGAGSVFAWHGSPFRPNRPYDFGDERIFTGRERETRELLHRLQEQMASGHGFLLLSGPSGSGKSSLIRAGLLPRLVRPHQIEGVAACRWCVVDPRQDATPLAALSNALCADGALGDGLGGLGVDRVLLHRSLEADPALAVGQVRAVLQGLTSALRTDTGDTAATARLLLVVDPLDSVLDADEVGPFAAALRALSECGAAWVVAVTRSDHLRDMPRLNGLAGLCDTRTWMELEPPDSARIRQVIEIPALVAGLEYETQGVGNLVEQLESEAVRLRLWPPLLQGTLQSLYEKQAATVVSGARGRRAGYLTLSALREGGGLAGEALRRADDLWGRLDEAARGALPRLCRALIGLEPAAGARPTPRRGDLDTLESEPACRRLTAALIDAGLVIAEGVHDPLLVTPCQDRDDTLGGMLGRVARQTREEWRARLLRGGSADSEILAVSVPARSASAQGDLIDWRAYGRRASLAHAVLIERWKPMREWLARAENREALGLRHQITRQAQLWKRTDCNREYLLGEAGYAAAHRFRSRYATELEPIEAELLRQSRRQLRFQRRRNQMVRITGILLAGLLLIATTAAYLALEASRTATANLQRSQLFAADLAIVRGNTPRAVVLALDAGRYLPDKALQTLSKAFTANRMIALLHEGAPNPGLPLSAAIDAEGERAATLDPAVGMRLWRLEGLGYVPAGPAQMMEQAFHSVYYAPVQGGGTFLGVAPEGIWRLPVEADTPPDFACGSEAGAVLATSRDGRLLAMSHALAPDSHAVCLLDLLRPGPALFDTVIHSADINSLDFSADGSRLLTASGDGTAKVLDTASGAILLSLPTAGSPRRRTIHSAVFSPDGERIALASTDDSIWIYGADGAAGRRLFDVPTREGRRQVHASDVHAIAFSDDGRFLVAGDEDGQLVRWDLGRDRGAIVLGQHEQSVVQVEVSPDGRHALTASLDKTARLWDIENGGQVAIFSHDGAVSRARFSAAGHRAFTLSHQDGTARLWSTTPISALSELMPHHDHVRHLAFAPMPADNTIRLATASHDGTVTLWELLRRNGELVQTGALVLKGHSRPVGSVSFSPGGERLVSASSDGTARIWHLEEGMQGDTERCRLEVSLTETPAPVHEALFAPSRSSRWVVTAADAEPTPLALWDSHTCERLDTGAVFDSGSAAIRALDVKALAEGTLVVTGSDDGRVRVLREAPDGTWSLVCDVALHTLPILDLAISPDGTRIASASEDRWGRIMGIEGCGGSHPSIADMIGHVDAIRSVRFAPRGGVLVTGSMDGTARVWRQNGNLVQILAGHKNHVYYAEFSPDGRWILTASRDGTVGLWKSPAMNAPLQASPYLVLDSQLGGVPFAQFSPDGHYIGAAYWKDAAQAWRIWADGDGLKTQAEQALAEVWGRERANLVLVRAAQRFRRDNRLDELPTFSTIGE
jgi:WD40 repeat protein